MKNIYFNKLFRKVTPVFDKRKNIILFSTDEYHSIHLYPVIKKLTKCRELRVFLVGAFKTISNCTHYSTLDELSIFLKYDLYVSTEQHIPWKIEVKKVFFGHGIGPKLDYQTNLYLNKFDYLFTPCHAIHGAQKVLKPKLIKVGLPLLDSFEGVLKTELLTYFNFKEESKPIIVYAPSWNLDVSKISDISAALKMLSSLSCFNIVISPHPNLLEPDLCQGKNFFVGSSLSINQYFNTLELCATSDLVISDISSILFEAMALNKNVLFDGNEDVYLCSGAELVLEDIKKSIPTVFWNEGLEQQLSDVCVNNKESLKREEFIATYLFNKGNASEVFKNSILEIISND